MDKPTYHDHAAQPIWWTYGPDGRPARMLDATELECWRAMAWARACDAVHLDTGHQLFDVGRAVGEVTALGLLLGERWHA